MLTTSFGAGLLGIDGFIVTVECHSTKALPGFEMVGLPDAAVKESHHRVSTAIANSGFRPFEGRTTVNLAPADVHKDGSLFDLPIALAILVASGEVPLDGSRRRRRPGDPSAPPLRPMDPATTALAGELSLGGELRPVRGVLPLALAMRDAGATDFLVPEANAPEAAVVRGLRVWPARSLRHAADLLSGADAPIRTERASADGRADFFYLRPGEYYVRCFVDRNGDGEWTTGHFDSGLHPEPTYYFPKAISVKAQWELEQDWELRGIAPMRQKPAKITKQKPDKDRKVKERNKQREAEMRKRSSKKR